MMGQYTCLHNQSTCILINKLKKIKENNSNPQLPPSLLNVSKKTNKQTKTKNKQTNKNKNKNNLTHQICDALLQHREQAKVVVK